LERSTKGVGGKIQRRPKPASLSFIEELQRTAGNRAVSMLIARAGAPRGLPAPNGIAQIDARSVGKGTRGLTLIPNSVAFQQPAFQVTVSAAKTGTHSRSYSAKVEPTRAPDVEHESLYPLEGHHRIRVDPGNRPAYGYVSDDYSKLIHDGEDEHLKDAALAHRMSYGCVANEVNALANQTATTPFTSDKSMAEAQEQANQALAARLPSAFGKTTAEKIHPSTWMNLLDSLLKKTTERDVKGWHWMEEQYTENKHKGLDVYDIVKTGFFRVPGDRVVKY
jgi:hypothetical protein